MFEHLRATVGTGLLTKDEAELFMIANSFGTRHHKPKQATHDSLMVFVWCSVGVDFGRVKLFSNIPFVPDWPRLG